MLGSEQEPAMRPVEDLVAPINTCAERPSQRGSCKERAA
jgi:hypothetical protein